jgi:hypothetical protein
VADFLNDFRRQLCRIGHEIDVAELMRAAYAHRLESLRLVIAGSGPYDHASDPDRLIRCCGTRKRDGVGDELSRPSGVCQILEWNQDRASERAIAQSSGGLSTQARTEAQEQEQLKKASPCNAFALKSHN